MQSRELNIIEKWKRNHQGSSWTSRDCRISRPQSPVIALQSRKFAVEPRVYFLSRTGDADISSLFSLSVGFPISHPRLSHSPSRWRRKIIRPPPLSLVSSIFHFPFLFFFLFARCRIEAKLLLMLARTGAPFTTDAPRCADALRAAQLRTHVRTSAYTHT